MIIKSNSTNRTCWTIKKLDDNYNATDAGNDQYMFVSTILEKIKETKLKFSRGSVTVLQKNANYQEARVKLTNTQLTKLKYVAKSKTERIIRINKKTFKMENWRMN